MREILFRGKRVDTGEWLESESINQVKKGEVYLWSDKGRFIVWVPVHPETVGQFTGLYDSTKWEELTEAERSTWTRIGNLPSEWKGKRIFGGDQFDFNGDIGIVKFDEKTAAFVVDFGDSCDDLQNVALMARLIGNIHDNPELLK